MVLCYLFLLLLYFSPKKFDLATITQQEVDRVAELINNRPRKCLGWYSATEVFRNRKNIKKNNTIKYKIFTNIYFL